MIVIITSFARTAYLFSSLNFLGETNLLKSFEKCSWYTLSIPKNGIPLSTSSDLSKALPKGPHLLNLIDEVFLLEPCGYSHPAIWFREVFLENEAIGIYAKTEGDAEKTAYMSEFSNANQQLWTLVSNPFSKPNTKALFDLALEMAERYDRFRPHLRAFASSRRKLATYLRENTELLNKSPTGSKIIARQGRKKKKKTKVDSETLSSKGFQRK